MNVHPRACVCIINKRQKANSLGNITWSELGNKTYKVKSVFVFCDQCSVKWVILRLIIMLLMQKNIREIRKIDKQR